MKGLKDFQKNIRALERFAEELHGELGTVEFDPSDPVSIENAIARANDIIEEKSRSAGGSEMVEKIAAEIKEKFRQSIIDRAAALRAGGSQ